MIFEVSVRECASDGLSRSTRVRAESALDAEQRGIEKIYGRRARDRAELLRLGAECLGIALSDDAVASRMAFDHSVGPMLWQLLPLGQLRTAEMRWMTPAARERFPWRSRGAELPHHALHEREHFADVARRFPEAAGHLDAVLRTYPASPAREAARAAVRAAAAAAAQ